MDSGAAAWIQGRWGALFRRTLPAASCPGTPPPSAGTWCNPRISHNPFVKRIREGDTRERRERREEDTRTGNIRIKTGNIQTKTGNIQTKTGNIQKTRPSKVPYGANHCAGQLGET
jgi:hypothetical protein